MIVTETKFQGVFIIDLKLYEDGRGFFAEAWTQRELADWGMEGRFVQGNISYNKLKGTLRGMHYQVAPNAQGKLISCTAGAMFDVGIDLRPDSATFRQWIGVELSRANHRMLYLPGDFAHGYQTLENGSEVSYLVTAPFAPASERGVRWDDPAFGVEWPLTDNPIILARDCAYADFDEQRA